MSTKDKKMSNEELNNVSGGSPLDGMIVCENCHQKYKGAANVVTKGEGCDEEKYYKCPHCGHEVRFQ